MKTRITIFIAICCSISIHAQTIQDPVRDGAKPGRTYFVWKMDINHDGTADTFVTEKPTEEEVQDMRTSIPFFLTDNYVFAAYIGLRDSSGYNIAGNIAADVSRCYIGYIEQLKVYGIVTLEERVVDDPEVPQAKHGVLKKRVCAYVLEADQMRKKDLTPLLDDWEASPLFKSYLSDAKRTKVELQEVTP